MSKRTVTTVTPFIDDQEIPCMILPMIGHHLLMPTTSVAEMSSVSPLRIINGAPKWLFGLYPWRGMEVPVISVEAINGQRRPSLNPQGRIAVLNNTGVDTNLAFIAVHTQGIPRMARIAQGDIKEDPKNKKRPFDLMAVKVGLEEFFLPNVAAFERAYLKLLTAQ